MTGNIRYLWHSSATNELVRFQRDGAPPYYAGVLRNDFDELFHGNVIGRRRAIEMPPRSPDHTLMDLFWRGEI